VGFRNFTIGMIPDNAAFRWRQRSPPQAKGTYVHNCGTGKMSLRSDSSIVGMF
jgi:hypothetical protein